MHANQLGRGGAVSFWSCRRRVAGIALALMAGWGMGSWARAADNAPAVLVEQLSAPGDMGVNS